MGEKIIVIYKRVGKELEYMRIDNTKEEFEKLVGGEFETVNIQDYALVYNKNSKNMLANVIVDAKGYNLGLTLRGNVVAVALDNKGKFATLNKEIAVKAGTLFKLKSLDYSNFDNQGRYIKNSRKRKNLFKNNKDALLAQEKTKQDLKVDKESFEKNIKLVEVKKEDKDEKTNNVIGENDKGKLVLERTPETSTSTETSNPPPPTISLSDETILKMILKILFIILDFINNAMDDSDE